MDGNFWQEPLVTQHWLGSLGNRISGRALSGFSEHLITDISTLQDTFSRYIEAFLPSIESSHLPMPSDNDVMANLSQRNSDFIDTRAKRNCIGNAYLAQQKRFVLLEKLNEDTLEKEWSKLINFKEKFQERVKNSFLKYEESRISDTIRKAPLLIPIEIVNSVHGLERLLQSKWTNDCLGRTLLHIILDNTGTDNWTNDLLQTFVQTIPYLRSDINRKDIFGRSALSVACEHHNHGFILALINAGAKLSSRAGVGLGALHFAAPSGNNFACDLILNTKDSEMDRADDFGRLPLHFAARNGHEAVVRVFLAKRKEREQIKKWKQSTSQKKSRN
jgi:ankyrin repeat protein